MHYGLVITKTCYQITQNDFEKETISKVFDDSKPISEIFDWLKGKPRVGDIIIHIIEE
jgi:hypothetical protein